MTGFGRAFDEVLGFFQAEARDFAHGLDHVDLLVADSREDDGEFRLLFDGRGGGAAGGSAATAMTGMAAAALMPYFSSSFLTRSEISSIVA